MQSTGKGKKKMDKMLHEIKDLIEILVLSLTACELINKLKKKKTKKSRKKKKK